MITKEALLDLRNRIEEHYRDRLDAVDTLLRTLPDLEKPPQQRLRMLESRPRRVRGVLAVVRQIIPDLPQPFDRRQVLEKLREVDSELAAKVTLGNLRNTLRLLAKEGRIELTEEATSTKPARFARKVA